MAFVVHASFWCYYSCEIGSKERKNLLEESRPWETCIINLSFAYCHNQFSILIRRGRNIPLLFPVTKNVALLLYCFNKSKI
jgi:hypothetical protein